MASDVGLTTSELSPSASLSSTGRIWPRLERGGPGFLPKAAARPTSSESAREGAEIDGRVRCLARRSGPFGWHRVEGFVGVARFIHGF